MHERYVRERECEPLEIWKPNRRPRNVTPGWKLRIQAPRRFRLRWTFSEWEDARDADSTATAVGVHYVDLPVPEDQRAPVRFTFYWTASDRWEGEDFALAARSAASGVGGR